MKTAFVLLTLLIAHSSFAQIQTGSYSGSVLEQTTIHHPCEIKEGSINFADLGNGSYSIRWMEMGIMINSPAQESCGNLFDAILTPTQKPNEWKVSFVGYARSELNPGMAKLKGDTLMIQADYNGSVFGNIRMNAQIQFKADHTIDYTRKIDEWLENFNQVSGTFK